MGLQRISLIVSSMTIQTLLYGKEISTWLLRRTLFSVEANEEKTSTPSQWGRSIQKNGLSSPLGSPVRSSRLRTNM